MIALYQSAGHLPPDIPVRHHDTMEETLALLAAHGVVPDASLDDERSSWRGPYSCLGPAARALLNPCLLYTSFEMSNAADTKFATTLMPSVATAKVRACLLYTSRCV